MAKKYTYLEKDRVVNESSCKFMKRMIIGFIRYYESQGSEANIPEEFFDDVPDNLGFEFDFFESDEGQDLRCFDIIQNWETNKDDCGGDEMAADEVVYSAAPEKEKENKVVHLKLV